MTRTSKFTREALRTDPDGVDLVVERGAAILLPRAARRLTSEARGLLLEAAAVGRQIEALGQREDELVRAARGLSVPWGHLAAVLGMSEQGLRRKYADVVEAERAERAPAGP